MDGKIHTQDVIALQVKAFGPCWMMNLYYGHKPQEWFAQEKKPQTILNHRTCNINAPLHAGFLCLRLYFHEYANFIKHYSDHSTLEMGREERGGTEKHHTETSWLPCSVQGGEMRSVTIYRRTNKSPAKQREFWISR